VTLLPRPNYLESLPTKLFEYMAMGIPVLASDFPLWRQLVEAAGSGRLAAPVPAEVAAALVAMCSDPVRLRLQGEAGRAAYRERYRWEVESLHLRWHLQRAGLGPALETVP
jgi:glycosyltransferase involved in cell wall biosynthesis